MSRLERLINLTAALLHTDRLLTADELHQRVPGYADDRNTFLVYTRWRSEEDFLAWVQSPAFSHGHKAHHQDGPVSTHSELWSFEVAQHERAASDS